MSHLIISGSRVHNFFCGHDHTLKQSGYWFRPKHGIHRGKALCGGNEFHFFCFRKAMSALTSATWTSLLTSDRQYSSQSMGNLTGTNQKFKTSFVPCPDAVIPLLETSWTTPLITLMRRLCPEKYTIGLITTWNGSPGRVHAVKSILMTRTHFVPQTGTSLL